MCNCALKDCPASVNICQDCHEEFETHLCEVDSKCPSCRIISERPLLCDICTRSITKDKETEVDGVVLCPVCTRKNKLLIKLIERLN